MSCGHRSTEELVAGRLTGTCWGLGGGRGQRQAPVRSGRAQSPVTWGEGGVPHWGRAGRRGFWRFTTSFKTCLLSLSSKAPGLFCFPHLFVPEKATWLLDRPALALSRRETCLVYSDVTYWHVQAIGMEK